MAITALEASAGAELGAPPGKGCGIRVLNLAAWTTAAAHCHAEQNPNLRTATQRFPGVAGIAVHRFTPYRAVAA
jgi:hypothetical protein